MRDYGKGPDGEDMVFNGLSARMSELHASVGMLSLENAKNLVDSRMRLITKYRKLTARLPGCRVQEFPDDRSSSGNYFTLLIGPDARADRDAVRMRLKLTTSKAKDTFTLRCIVKRLSRDFLTALSAICPTRWPPPRNHSPCRFFLI